MSDPGDEMWENETPRESQLSAENARLREALRKINNVPKMRHTSGHLHDCAWCNGSAEIAREAIAYEQKADGK